MPGTSFDAILALCARAQGHPAQHERLARLAQALPSWEGLSERAEAHGLIPLLSDPPTGGGRGRCQTGSGSRCRATLCSTPTPRGCASRCWPRCWRSIATRASMRCCSRARRWPSWSTPSGHCAPCATSTSSCGHRMRRARRRCWPRSALRPLRRRWPGWADHHHLAAIKRAIDGFSISVEVHRGLNLNEPGRPPRTFEEFALAAQPLAIGGVAAQTLGCEDTLWHIYRHAFCMLTGYESLRLIWVADLVSLVEAWLDRIDWERVEHQHPAAYAILPLLHALTPWREAAATRFAQAPAPSPLPAELDLQRRTAMLEETLGHAASLRTQVAQQQILLGEQSIELARARAGLDERATYIVDLDERPLHRAPRRNRAAQKRPHPRPGGPPAPARGRAGAGEDAAVATGAEDQR